jgi:hypothetical protein
MALTFQGFGYQQVSESKRMVGRRLTDTASQGLHFYSGPGGKFLPPASPAHWSELVKRAKTGVYG